MGQKVNPIAVRLNFNRFSDSSWFTDYYYSRLLYQDFNFRQYLNSIKQPNANKLGFRAARCIIHHFPKRTLIHLFCLSDPRKKVLETYQKRPESYAPRIGASAQSADFGISFAPRETESFSINNNYSVVGEEILFAGKTEVSLYWLKSSILEKKRALINLHRGIAKSFSELRYIPLEDPSEKVKRYAFAASYAYDSCAPNERSYHTPKNEERQHNQHNSYNSYTKRDSLRSFERQSSLSKSALGHRPGWLFRLAPIVGANFFDFTSILFSKKSYKNSNSNSSELVDVKNLYGTMWSAINSISGAQASSLAWRSPREVRAPVCEQRARVASNLRMQATLENNERKLPERFMYAPYAYDSCAPSVPLKLDILNGPYSHLRTRSYFSFYAMHYFFMRKTNSFYLSKHGCCIAYCSCAPSLYFDGISVNTYGQQMRAVQTESPAERYELKPILCFSANTIWPSLHNINESPNRAVWQLLSLDWSTKASTRQRGVPQSELRTFRSFFKMKQNSTKNKRLAHPKSVVGKSVVRAHGPYKIMKSLDFYLSNVHFILSETLRSFISLRAIKVNSVFQSAFLVAQEVACKLEQKKSFRLICRLIFQELRTSCNYIKGIRIACSGRLNGAEIAKTECRKFGETSLHIFSDKIDYGQTRASTPYGILGIKVWISYI